MKTKHILRVGLTSLAVIAGGFAVAQTATKHSPDRTNHPPRPDERVPPPQPLGRFGDPLPGLTSDQTASFVAGKAQFQEEDGIENGLGPVYNNVSCVACHSSPAIGGASPILETRFGKMTNGHFDPLASGGGSLLQQAAINPACQESIPADANVVAGRKTTQLFGLGLIEAIPDATILANIHRNPVDGITGKAAMILDVATNQQRVGRFGWKDQQATVLAFSGDAYVNEMGITNRLFPTENAPNGNPALLAQYDTIADPEDTSDPVNGKADIDRFADFMRFLAPPPPLPATSVTAQGRALFQQINCTGCHVPSMSTGPNPINALNWKSVPLYSDLLLHDMGTLGDGIAQGAAAPAEMRTAPLWGLRARPPYLHDGRAATLDAAIRLHDGEAAIVRDRYVHLSQQQRDVILAFLNSL